MTASIQTKPINFLGEDFDPDNLHPADIEQILISAWDEYFGGISMHLKKQYRNKYNSLVDLLAEKRGFQQFNYLH